LFAGPLAHKARGKDVFTTVKKRPEQADLLGRRLRSRSSGIRRRSHADLGLASERRQLGSERSKPDSSIVLLGVEPNQSRLFLADGVEEFLTSRRPKRTR
jgi:hypothetical protein